MADIREIYEELFHTVKYTPVFNYLTVLILLIVYIPFLP